MKDLVFITGNQHKADYLAKWLDMPIIHQKVDLDEVQSLDLRTVVEDKARRAYEIVRQPVLVEDVGLEFTALGKLPGTFIKWFLEELGNEGLCKLLDGYENRAACASIIYGLYDGTEFNFFESQVLGQIAQVPRGKNGFGWNPIFIPEGSDKTYAEMTDDEVRPFSVRAKAIEKLHAHLTS